MKHTFPFRRVRTDAKKSLLTLRPSVRPSVPCVSVPLPLDEFSEKLFHSGRQHKFAIVIFVKKAICVDESHVPQQYTKNALLFPLYQRLSECAAMLCYIHRLF